MATVTSKPRTARPLVTIGPDAECWRSETMPENFEKGAIVRIKPPPDATDARLNAVVEQCKRQGAIAIRITPPDPGTSKATKQTAVPTVQSHRRVVEDLVAGMKSSDKKALEELCAEVMDEEGL